ncbi:MAG: S41 family peptidase [Pirellulales bacterium]|nr:S41 family peptidase [Pirellulales bacterium]
MMRLRSSSRSALALLFGVVVSFGMAGSTMAQQVRIPSIVQPSLQPVQVQPPLQPVQSQPTHAVMAGTELAELLDKGKELEAQRRWAEAFALYEDAARKTPGQPDLERRLDFAKLHFDVGRRYADSSFRKSVATLSDSEALEIYSDAAAKVQSHYVQNPDWNRLVGRGAAALEVALSEQTFVEHNLSGVNPDRMSVFVGELRKQMGQRSIRSRIEARDAVWNVAHLARLHLGVQPAATILEFTTGMLGGLDEYSTFLTSGQLADLYSQIEGNFVGLGVELKANEGSLLIVNVIHGSPAEAAGIKSGDRIVEVGGRSTADLSTDAAAELLQGVEGSFAQLMVATADEAPRALTVKRQHVDVPSVDDVRIIDREFGVGYFKLTCFQKTTSRDLDAALWQLHREGMRSLVIDLRGNPGGLLTSGVEVADKFIEQGSIVSTKGRSPGEDFNYTAQRTGTWRVPLVVLIDGDSASAAEILAGALRDYHRATLVGQRSYGKGSVQGIFPLSTGGAGVRLTTAKFYSPLGKPFARVGVEPDVKVQVAAKPIDGRIAIPVSASNANGDAILNAGLEAARQQVAQR